MTALSTRSDGLEYTQQCDISSFFRSLNREKRMRELLRVTQENQQILKRIMMRKPELNHETWERDWEQNQLYMDNISSFPKDWWLYQDNGQPLEQVIYVYQSTKILANP